MPSSRGSMKEASSHEEGPPPQRKRGCLAHCKKFWWAYLIGTLAIVLLVVLLIIFVAIPKIAQKKMDESELIINSIVISDTEPTQYRMEVDSTIRTDGKIHADIDGFRGVMYLEDLEGHNPFATIDFPETTSAKESNVKVDQIVQVDDLDAFTTFNTWLLANESLKMTIEGDTTVHVKGLSKGYGVTFKKTVELKGLNGFDGLEVEKSSVRPARTVDNYNATVEVPNTSILTIDIGNATFQNHLDGEPIGQVYMNDLVLKPGVNKVQVRGDMLQEPVILALTSKPYCEVGGLPFELRGQNVTKNGEEIPYFADALRALSHKVDVELFSAFEEALTPLTCLK